MAIINYSFFKNEDGLVYKNKEEEIILDTIKKYKRDDLQEYLNDAKDYLEYHNLSIYRENLVNWYPFKKESSCLEVGAGFGALTGCLCEKSNRVVSIEMTESRAKVINERYKDVNNLEIIVGNIDDVILEEKFDYVVVVGVLEYAKKFIKSDNPHITFMEKLKKFLKDDGVILLAIENRLGLCYFAGLVEGHTNKLFLGLNNYDKYDYIRTFSKKELTEIINEAGFKNHRFFYPFPNYAFPIAIYTDEALDYMSFGKHYPNICIDRFSFFDEIKMYRTLQKENIVTNFSNAFLVEISNSLILNNNILYAKSSATVNQRNRILTTFEKKEGELSVKKTSLSDNSEYIQGVFDKYIKMKENKAFSYPAIQIKEKSIERLYINNKSLDDKINNLLDEALKSNINIQKYIKEIKNIFNCLIAKWENNITISNDICKDSLKCLVGEFTLDYPTKCIINANLNPKLSDFIVTDNEIFNLNCENIADFFIPLNFWIYQIINNWWEKYIYGYKNAEKIINKNELYCIFGLNNKEILMYKDWREKISRKLLENFGIIKFTADIYNPKFSSLEDIKKYGEKV